MHDQKFERLLPSSSHITLIRSQSSPRGHERIRCAGVGSMDYNITLQTELPCHEEQKDNKLKVSALLSSFEHGPNTIIDSKSDWNYNHDLGWTRCIGLNMWRAEQDALCRVRYVVLNKYIVLNIYGLDWIRFIVLNMCLRLNKIHCAEHVAWAEQDTLCWTRCIGLKKMHYAEHVACTEQDASCWISGLRWTRCIVLNIWLGLNKMHCA